MTDKEIERSIKMKENGADYREIAEAMLQADGEDQAVIINEHEGCYPALSRYINEHYGGNVAVFAKVANVPKGTLYGVLYGIRPSKATIDKVLVATGMTYEEIFLPNEGREAAKSQYRKSATDNFCYNGCPWEHSGVPCPSGGRPERCTANHVYQDAAAGALGREELHKRLTECTSENIALRMENEELRNRLRKMESGKNDKEA